MYMFLLAVHNILRWVVLMVAIAAVIRASLGWLRHKAWISTDRKLGMFVGITLDTQLLVGLLLYIFYSPLTLNALKNLRSAMSIPDLRFFAIEHALLMLLAVVFAHLGSILPRRVDDALSKHKRAVLWFTLTLIMVLAGIPWSRPLVPGL